MIRILTPLLVFIVSSCGTNRFLGNHDNNSDPIAAQNEHSFDQQIQNGENKTIHSPSGFGDDVTEPSDLYDGKGKVKSECAELNGSTTGGAGAQAFAGGFASTGSNSSSVSCGDLAIIKSAEGECLLSIGERDTSESSIKINGEEVSFNENGVAQEGFTQKANVIKVESRSATTFSSCTVSYVLN